MEHDSYTDQYDALATYDIAKKITPAAPSADTITSGLNEDIVNITTNEPVTYELGGHLQIGSTTWNHRWLQEVGYEQYMLGVGIVYVPENADVTIDLKGYTMTFDYTGGNFGSCFYVAEGAKLTIKNGQLVFNDDIVKVAYECEDNAEFIIDESVTVTGVVDTDQD